MVPCIFTGKKRINMPYVNKPRPYKKEYQQQKARDEQGTRNTRARARYELDSTGIDKNNNGKSDAREGKDIDHVKPLSKGGTNAKGNLQIKPAHVNRSFSRNSDHTVKKNKPPKKTK